MNYNKEEILNYYKEVANIRKELLQRVADEKTMDMPTNTVEYEKYSSKNKKLMERNLTIDQKMEEVFLNIPDNSGYITHTAIISVSCDAYIEHTMMKNFLESKGFLSNKYSVSGNRQFSAVIGSDSREGVDELLKDINEFANKYYLKVKAEPVESKQEAFNSMMKALNPILLGSKVNEILYFPLVESLTTTHSFSKLSRMMVNENRSLFGIKEFEFQVKSPDDSKLKLSIVDILKRMPNITEDSDRTSYREGMLKELKKELHQKTGVDEKIDYDQYNVDGKKAVRGKAIEFELLRFKNLIDNTPHIEIPEIAPKEPSLLKSFILGIKNRVDGAKEAIQKGGDIVELKQQIESEKDTIFRLTGLNIEVDIKQHFVGEKSIDNAVRGYQLELERFKKINQDLLRIPNIVEEVSEQGLSTEPARVEEKAVVLRKNGVKLQ